SSRSVSCHRHLMDQWHPPLDHRIGQSPRIIINRNNQLTNHPAAQEGEHSGVSVYPLARQPPARTRICSFVLLFLRGVSKSLEASPLSGVPLTHLVAQYAVGEAQHMFLVLDLLLDDQGAMSCIEPIDLDLLP